MQEQVIKALDMLRPALQADNSDIILDRIEDLHVYLKLVVTPETCLDCLLPTAHLQAMLTNAINEETGACVTVHLEDPRSE